MLLNPLLLKRALSQTSFCVCLIGLVMLLTSIELFVKVGLGDSGTIDVVAFGRLQSDRWECLLLPHLYNCLPFIFPRTILLGGLMLQNTYLFGAQNSAVHSWDSLY